MYPCGVSRQMSNPGFTGDDLGGCNRGLERCACWCVSGRVQASGHILTEPEVFQTVQCCAGRVQHASDWAAGSPVHDQKPAYSDPCAPKLLENDSVSYAARARNTNDARIRMGGPAVRPTAAPLNLPCPSSAASAGTADPTSRSAPVLPSLPGLAC